MGEKRGVNIHFVDGSNVTIGFPQQVEDDTSAVTKFNKLLEMPQLVFEVDGDLYIFQTCNIKYIRLHPAQAKLPDYVIKGAAIKT